MAIVATKIVNELSDQVNGLREENGHLKSIIAQIHSTNSLILSKMEDVLDYVTQTHTGVSEAKTTEFYGKKVSILPQAVDEVKKLTGSEIRQLIHKAAHAHGNSQRKGYTQIYNKLKELTGVDVYGIGKLRLKESDGVDGWKKDPSYINTIFKKSLHHEVAIIAKEIIKKQ